MLSLRNLQTFIAAADAGSFRRAADRMYITPSAVIKQIDALETEAGVELFERTAHGLNLTPAGRSLYNDGKMILEYAEKSLEKARSTADEELNVLRIGTSPVTGADLITDLWGSIYHAWPELKMQIIPFQNTPEQVSALFADLGSEIDVITGVCDDVHLAYRNCAGTALEEAEIGIAVPVRHPFVRRQAVSLKDLRSQEIMILSEGKIEALDRIRRDLRTMYPDIRLRDFDFFGMDVFNRCEKEGCVLITTEHWIKAHPMLRMIHMDWEYTLPYGIIYARQPSAKIRRFLSLIQK